MLDVLETLVDVLDQQIAEWDAMPAKDKARACACAASAVKSAERIRSLAKKDALRGVPIENAEHGIRFAIRWQRGPVVLDAVQTWKFAEEHGVKLENFLQHAAVYPNRVADLLEKTGMKRYMALELLETCGERREDAPVLIRRDVEQEGETV